MKIIGKSIIALLIVWGLAAPGFAQAASSETQALLEELKALKARVAQMEQKLENARQAADQAHKAAMDARKTSGHSLKLSQEAAKAKAKQPGGFLTEAGKRLKVYGAVELEASYAKNEPDGGQSTTESNLTLATAEVFFDATINKYTKGLLHLLYEEGDTDPINIDEAFILIGQTEDIPYYFMGGRMYPAIGMFETYMISDPITQNLFETQASAVEIGWAQDWFNLGVGGFNSSVHKASDDPDSTVNTYYVRIQFDAPENLLGEGVDINAGLAYTNNIAGGNLGDEVADGTLQDLVAGWSVMVGLQYKSLALTAEYIAALDDFQPGELSFMENNKAKPTAYNLELAYMPNDQWTFALRYEGGSDLGDFEPDRQYGFTVSWALLSDTTLSLEYLRGDYENNGTRDLVTSQLAVAF